MRSVSPSEIKSLAASLSKNGQLCAIRIRPHPTLNGRYQVIFGNRRLEAAKLLGWDTIEAQVTSASDLDSALMAFSENLDREDLSDYEKALFLEKMHRDTGKSYAELSEIIGKSVSFVSLHVGMLHLFAKTIGTDEERGKVLSQLTERHARALSRILDPLERWNTAKLAILANLSVRELEKICNRLVSNHPKHRHRNRQDSDLGSDCEYYVDEEDARNVRALVKEIMDGFNSGDVEPFFKAISPHRFTMYTSYPPFSTLDVESAKAYLRRVYSQLDSWRERVKDLSVRIIGKVAYATFTVSEEIDNTAKHVNCTTRATIILEKEKVGRHTSEWKIVHGHYSSANPVELLDIFSRSNRHHKASITK